MKRTRSFLVFLILLSLFTGVFSSCGPEKDPEPDAETFYRVMLTCSAGVRVTSENPVRVKAGATASFTVEFGETFAPDSLSDGRIDGNRVLVENVNKDMSVELKAIDLGYSTSESFFFFLYGGEKDTSSVGKNKRVGAGERITVNAGDEYRIFLGWSLGAFLSDGAPLLSAERAFTFRASPDLVSGGNIGVFANYVDSSTYYLNPNGGTVDTSSRNMRASEFYTATMENGAVKIVFSENYAAKFGCLCTFWDDGTFSRPGYVLKEYNTKADGSGEGYSLGSKFFSKPQNEQAPVLYCIWERAEESLFSARDFSLPRPSGISVQNAPDWHESGVIITGCTATAETVAIPESIGGKPVIAIDANAFSGLAAKTVIFPRTLLSVADGAFVGCSALETLYLCDSVWSIGNDAFDTATYRNFGHLVVNATKAPRFSNTGEGGFAYKLAKLLRTEGQKRVIMIAGSSSYQGFATEYLEALFGDYAVVNFGTTRTTQGTIYLEAMGHFATEKDIVLYAPENSIYMLGEPELYWKTLRDLENMNNFYRYIDISRYTNVFGAFTEFNQLYAYQRKPLTYEQVILRTELTENGDYVHPQRAAYAGATAYHDAYFITMNERVKSKHEGLWSNVAFQTQNKDHTDPNNPTWASFTDPIYASLVNHAFLCARSSGARAYFTFCPVDADKLIPEAQHLDRLSDYDNLVHSTYYEASGVLGQSKNYIFAHEYFYDCAFHPNDYGRVYRTYRIYFDLCDLLGRTAVAPDARGTSFEGCLFEKDCAFGPRFIVPYLNAP